MARRDHNRPLTHSTHGPGRILTKPCEVENPQATVLIGLNLAVEPAVPAFLS